MFSSIKTDKKLSFDFWRYRLLHWTFNVEERNLDPKNPTKSGLPGFLYTHYCPLFHITNIIVLMLPLILFFRFLGLVFSSIFAALKVIPWEKIGERLFSLLPEKKEKEVKPEVPKVINYEKQFIIFLKEKLKDDIDTSLIDLRFMFRHKYQYSKEEFTDETAKEIYDKNIDKFKAAFEKAKLRREKLKERLIFWSNFSRVFIKWGLYVLYAALGGLLVYLTYALAMPVLGALIDIVEWVCGLFTSEGTINFLSFIGKLILWGGLSIGFLYGMFKLGVAQKFLSKMEQGLSVGLEKLYIPFYAVGVFFTWCVDKFLSTVEFFKMFYEENCPSIEIVTPEEEIIENIAEGN